jgi:hypothetical protein
MICIPFHMAEGSIEVIGQVWYSVIVEEISMATGRITVDIDEQLHNKLAALAVQSGLPESAVIRQAIEQFISHQETPVTCYDVAKQAGLIGSVQGLPPDLSTNPKYMEGFGRD